MAVDIAGYTDFELIGQGGFAVVYKARQVSVNRDVAIKLLTDPAPDDDLVRRFERESKAVGSLSWHPHIAAVVDAGATATGQAYIAFELLEGGSLEDRLQSQPMLWTEAVAAIVQIADAVEAAHRSQVLHRDIKPANILLNRLGVAKLGDFGIASMQDGTKTATGMLATTVAHAAPELFEGQPASTATDVYALGSTLHTLVSGQPPFVPPVDEPLATTISRILGEPPPRLDATLVPAPIANVIAHALAKQPQYRPRSAGAFGQTLQQAQRELGLPVTSMPFVQPDALSAASAPALHPTPDSAAASGSEADALARQDPETLEHRQPFRWTIRVLLAVAIALAVGLAALVFNERTSEPQPLLVTAGGASVMSFDALDATEMAPPMHDAAALDNDVRTAWGITSAGGTPVVGTSFVITFTEAQTIERVGLVHGPATPAAQRVTEVVWATSITNGTLDQERSVRQQLNDSDGPQLTPFDVRTDQLVVVIAGSAQDSETAAIAEILIETSP